MPQFSFILPTRNRPELVTRFFESVKSTTANLNELEIVLVVDKDDRASQNITDNALNLKKVVVGPGQTMGALNCAGFAACTGRFIMLVNDDIIIRTQGWDEKVLQAIAAFPDDICLIHVNDLLFREKLCTFPLLSKSACAEIGLCPTEYRRYRIDDHIYDTYNLLAHLGYRRIVYMPEVVFEHDNHSDKAEHGEKEVFESVDKKLYIPDQAILAKDAAFFEESFNNRKCNARLLAEIIQQSANQLQGGRWNTMLEKVTDSFSYRKAEYLQRFPAIQTGAKRMPRTTVAVSTADMRSPHASKCISLIKEHTKDFDLIVLDNNNSKSFQHPRDMNQVLCSIRTEHLALIDDDVFVEPGWLEGMQRALDEKTAVVLPLHKDAQGALAFSGCYFSGDNRGSHMHLLDLPTAVRVTPAYCSAIMLVDMNKIGSIRMDEIYAKYFFDIVHGLEVWEAGYQSVVTPEVTVTHIGGATAVRGTRENNEYWRRDGEVFAEHWVKTKRLEKIENGIWQQYDFLQLLVTMPRTIKTVFSLLEQASMEEIPELTLAMLIAFKDYPAYASLIREQLAALADRAIQQKAHQRHQFCGAALTWMNNNQEKIARQPHNQALACLERVQRFIEVQASRQRIVDTIPDLKHAAGIGA